jgi:hypothetical protein
VTTHEAFQSLTCQLDELNRTGNVKPAYVLADLNDLLTAAAGDQFESLPQPSIDDPYLSNYVAAMGRIGCASARRSPSSLDFWCCASFAARVRRAMAEPASPSASGIAGAVPST